MKVYGIFGDERVCQSKSPAMFTSVLNKLGIKGAYVPFNVEPGQLGHAVQSIRVLNMAGANVAAPYKEDVMPSLDILSEGANIIGAVNTIVRTGGELKGYNTNAIGIMDALSSIKCDVQGKSAIVFGTGGMAKAAVFILNWLRTKEVFVTGQDEKKVAETARRFKVKSMPFHRAVGEPIPANIIVNGASLSMSMRSTEMERAIENIDAPECELVFDLNYGPISDVWKQMAEKRGVAFMDGLSPLAFQARRTFALWTKIQVPPEDFIEALER